MARVYVSVGSNIDRERNVATALQNLAREFGELQQSRTYETEAVGFDGAPFHNLVVGFETRLAPQQVADMLRDIEDRQGRDRSGARLSDRSIDLDLLLYDDLVLDAPGLKLPRPEITQYAFVLRPLAEIAGELMHPQTGLSLASMWEGFDAAAQPMRPVDP